MMIYLATSGNGAGRFTASIVGVLSFVVLSPTGSGVDTRTNVAPSTVVHGFFLTPEKIGIGVFVKVRGNSIVREWRELFYATNRDILDSTFFTSLEKSKVHLTCRVFIESDYGTRMG